MIKYNFFINTIYYNIHRHRVLPLSLQNRSVPKHNDSWSKFKINIFFFFGNTGHQDHPETHPCLQFSLSAACNLQSTPLRNTSFLTTSSHLRRGLPSGLFPVRFSSITTRMSRLSRACPDPLKSLVLYRFQCIRFMKERF